MTVHILDVITYPARNSCAQLARFIKALALMHCPTHMNRLAYYKRPCSLWANQSDGLMNWRFGREAVLSDETYSNYK